MENEKGVPEVDSPLLTHLLSYVPQISQIYTDLETYLVFGMTQIYRMKRICVICEICVTKI